MKSTGAPGEPAREADTEVRRLPLGLAAAFALSGIAGLVYELVWTRYLALLVGHAAYAQVLVLAVYLGGTAVGSLLVAARSRALARPLRAYGQVEGGLAAFGLAFHALYLAGQAVLYRVLAPSVTSGAGPGLASWAVAILLILPQAVLLGTTFPLMAAGVLRRAPALPGRSIADVYLLNTLGGAAGILLGGFVLIPRVGLPGTAIAAAVLNAAAARLVWGGDVAANVAPVPSDPAIRPVDAPAGRILLPLLLIATLVSALASFLYEIGWVRMLSLLLGSATHAFELMLSAFLLGLAGGSLLVRRLADRSVRPLRAAGWIQWAMGLAALLTLPVYQACFPVMARLVTNLPAAEHGWLLFNAARYGIALAVMLPATLLAGMTLPLLTATLLRSGQGERAIGLANGANTIGSVAGAVAGGLVVMPRLGLEGILTLGAGVDMLVGVALLASAAAAVGSRTRAFAVGAGSGAAAVLLVVAVTGAVRLDRALLTSGVYRTGRVPGDTLPDILFYRDGATATVSAQRMASGTTTLTTNGKPDASLPLRWLERARGAQVLRGPIAGGDEATQIYGPLVLLAHNPGARHGAVIGHGSGMSAQLLLGSSRLEHLTIIEIEPAIVEASRYFMPANRRPFEDARASFLFEDARTALAGGGPPLDLVFSEPSNPWVSGVASLFTVQFYERVRARLSEDGVFGQWFHLYEIEDDLVLSVLAAIDQSFPEWSAWLVGATDILIVAGKHRLSDPDFSVVREAGIRADLSMAPLPTAGQLESLRLFDAEVFRPLLVGRAANDDYRPILDTRAEHARFLKLGAEGFVAFREADLDLPRILARRSLTPLPYDSLPITGITPLSARALAGWLAVGDARPAAPFPDWQNALTREQSFRARVTGTDPPVDWGAWARIFVQVETARHARTAGWIDAELYGSVERYLEGHDPPADVRATVALLEGIRTLDFAAAAAAADVLGATEGPNRLVPTPLLLDAAVVGYLGSGRTDDARAAFRALAPHSGRSPSSARNLWLAAVIEGTR
jgi:spermidine synthase